MSNFILNNTAEEVNSAIGKVANATTTPLDDNPNMVTSGGVKSYVDTQISSLDSRVTDVESAVTNLEIETSVSLTRSSEFSTNSESFQNVPLSSQGQPPYFTNNGNNTFTILQGNYLMWFSFFWKTRFESFVNEMEVRLKESSGMSNFSGIGTFRGTSESYNSIKTTLLNAEFRSITEDTTFSLQIRDETEGNAYSVYVKDVVFTILRV